MKKMNGTKDKLIITMIEGILTYSARKSSVVGIIKLISHAIHKLKVNFTYFINEVSLDNLINTTDKRTVAANKKIIILSVVTSFHHLEKIVELYLILAYQIILKYKNTG